MTKFICKCCNKRLPKNRPLLVCSLCSCNKDYKCNNLSKTEACDISQNPALSRHWTCQDCYNFIFPGFDIPDISTKLDNHNNKTDLCGACNKPCSTKPSRKGTCPWCLKISHTQCIKNSLGCLDCCINMIPGYQYETYELNHSLFTNSHVTFDPYNRDAFINLIGENIDNESENWAEISDLMSRCNYKQAINIKHTQPNELRVLSLNIRSLPKNIEKLRENIDHIKKFDLICLCEINCDIDNLPNTYNDIILESFYKPIVQKPYRDSNKGGGLAIYVNKQVCGEGDFEKLDITIDQATNNTTNTIPCEHMFVKVDIKLSQNNCKKSYIIGNFYRSPSANKSLFQD